MLSVPTLLLLLLAVYKVVSLLRARSPPSYSYSLQVKQWEKDKIYFFCLGKAFGALDASPFGVKLEAFLRLHKLSYEVRNTFVAGPKGKFPYVEVNGTVVTDTALIIDHLIKEFKLSSDSSLSDAQRATSILVRRTVEEHLYFGVVWQRWQREQGWERVKPEYFQKVLPGFLYKFVPDFFIRPTVIASLQAQGIGRHSEQEIENMLDDDFSALATTLGTQQYFCGDRPTTVDCSVFAMLEAVLCVPPAVGAGIAERLRRHATLVNYHQRLRRSLFPELGQVAGPYDVETKK